MERGTERRSLQIQSAPVPWLRHYLERCGPSKIETVLAAGTLSGFGSAELFKAAAALAVESYGQPGDKSWRLTK